MICSAGPCSAPPPDLQRRQASLLCRTSLLDLRQPCLAGLGGLLGIVGLQGEEWYANGREHRWAASGMAGKVPKVKLGALVFKWLIVGCNRC